MISWWWMIPIMLVGAIVGAVITGVLLLDNCPRDDDDEGVL